MRLKEQRLWDRMRRNAPRSLRLERIENGVGVGGPDVHAISRGLTTWVELKAIDEWPVRATTPVLGNADGLNVDQRNWHLDYQQHGGRSGVLVSVGLEIFLFTDMQAIDRLNKMTKQEFYNEARCLGLAGTYLYLEKAAT